LRKDLAFIIRREEFLGQKGREGERWKEIGIRINLANNLKLQLSRPFGKKLTR